MGPLEFINDRAIFFGSVLVYHVWKETVGQDHWKTILSRFEDFHLITVGTLVMGFLVYIIVSALFAVVDLVMAPKGVIPGERLQPKKSHTWEQYKKSIPLVLFNFFVMSLPAVLSVYYFLHPASPRNAPGPSGMYPTLPSTFVLLRDILLSMVLREMVFYYLHRLFHHPFLYATFHKKHHEFTAPIAVSEAILDTVATHSGYICPGFPNADMHDFHHETFNSMFGLLGLADYIHGTDDKFKARIAKSKKIN